MSGDLDELERKLRAVESLKESKPGKQGGKADNESSRVGVQAGMELVVSIGAGIAAGIGLDKWLDTKPAFFLIFFFLGICTGFYNVYRVTNNLGSTVGFSRLHRSAKDAKKSPGTTPATEQDTET